MLTGSGLWRVMATSSLVVTGIVLFQFYMPIYGHSLGLSASVIGIVLAIFPGAAFVVRMFLPRMIGAAFGVFPVFWGNALLLASGGILSRFGVRRHRPQK